MSLTYYSNDKIEVGVDECGVGTIAGPVVASAVILPNSFFSPHIKDSKTISEKKRLVIEQNIKDNAIAYGIGVASVEEIDQINIRNARILAMHRALDQIRERYDIILVDGDAFTPYGDKKHYCIVKGDSKYINIAAASILAKNYRDKYMEEQGRIYPLYNFGKHKGYCTNEHVTLLKEHGACDIHRKTFYPVSALSS
jgi:ribonuclease HII